VQKHKKRNPADANHGRRATGFTAVARADARILVLGSLPGQRSIDAQEYYAHPQNTFWRIMAEVLGASGSYARRCAALLEARIALWDVLASSVRPGSLDADILLATADVNDFATFFASHESVDLILFNGQTAAQVFRRRVLPGLGSQHVRQIALPSTSPAHAAMSYADKISAWRAAIG
jgi:hypoxanthine-DNA glycosylase